MIRVKTILGKIFLLKTSDKQLFSSFASSVKPEDAVCHFCGAKSSCVSHSLYPRDMITVAGGRRLDVSVSIPRVLCTSCGHTHSLIPDILIPCGSYSLRFILTVLQGYLQRNCSVCSFCETWQISISTLYGWIHLFEEQASLWLGALNRIYQLSLAALNAITSVEDFPSTFFSSFGFSFMQAHKTSRLHHASKLP